MREATDSDSPSFFVADRIAGVVLALFYTGWGIWGDVVRYRAQAALSSGVQESSGFVPFPFVVASSILTLGLWLLVAFGIDRGKGWALLMGGLLGLQGALGAIGTFRSQAVPIVMNLPVVVQIALFVYCGLRLVGNVGPRPESVFAPSFSKAQSRD